MDDFRAAVLAFDAALREVEARRRPWHRALITERAACFRLAHGVDQMGHDLLARARDRYAAWGATANPASADPDGRDPIQPAPAPRPEASGRTVAPEQSR